MKQMEEERKERAILTLQLREQKLANDVSHNSFLSHMRINFQVLFLWSLFYIFIVSALSVFFIADKTVVPTLYL